MPQREGSITNYWKKINDDQMQLWMTMEVNCRQTAYIHPVVRFTGASDRVTPINGIAWAVFMCPAGNVLAHTVDYSLQSEPTDGEARTRFLEKLRGQPVGWIDYNNFNYAYMMMKHLCDQTTVTWQNFARIYQFDSCATGKTTLRSKHLALYACRNG